MANPTQDKVLDLDAILGWQDAVTRADRGIGLSDFLLDLCWMLGIQKVIMIHPGGKTSDTLGSLSTDFTESANGVFDATVESATPAEKLLDADWDNYLRLANTAATNNTQYVETTRIDGGTVPPKKISTGKAEMDWRDSKFVGFWVQQTDSWTAAELQFAIVNENDDGTQTITKHDVPATVNLTVWEYREVDISGTARDRVSAIRFYANNATAADKVNIQMIQRFRQGTSVGPVRGHCSEYEIQNGDTATKGSLARLISPDLTLTNAAADDTDIVGVFAVIGVGNATLKAKGVVQDGGYQNVRAATTAVNAAGEGVAAASATTFDNDAGANDLKTFGVSTVDSSITNEAYPIKLGKGPITVL